MTSAAWALDGADVGYGRTPVLRDVSFRIEHGEFVGILGPSGSGKTTLLRLLTGHARLLGGRAEVLGAELGRVAPRIGYVPQLGDGDLAFPLTVLQVVLLGAAADSRRRPWFSRAEHRDAMAMLDRLGIAELSERGLADISGGQRQRAYIARALLHDARLLLLDEPTSGVDLQVRADVLRLLGELNRDDGITVVLTTHDLNWVAAHLPRVLCVRDTLVADGTPDEVFTREVLRETYGTPMRVERSGGRLLVADEDAVLPGEGWA